MNRSSPLGYRAAIWLYPRQFRREFGADLEQTFRDLRRDRGAFSSWRRAIPDLLSSIPAEHLEALMARTSPPAVALTGSALLIATVVATVAYGSPAIALVASLIVACAAFGYRRRQTPYRESVRDSSRLWFWFLVAGLGLLGGLIGASKLRDNWNWFPWELLIVSVIFGWALIATGLLLALIELKHRVDHRTANA